MILVNYGIGTIEREKLVVWRFISRLDGDGEGSKDDVEWE